MKKILLIAALFFAGHCAMQGQVVVDEDVEEEDEEVVMDDEEGEEEEEEDVKGTGEDDEFPEDMSAGLDSLMNMYMSKHYLSIDEDCRMKDENPQYPVEVFIERLGRMPTVMEMAYNDIVRKHIDRYCEKLRRQVAFMLGASNFYMPLFEEALEAYGIPLELKFLPIIESALKPTAVSHAGAAGLWQFMIGTGKLYGLKVNSLVDERRDPQKASYAAAHYLSDLYKVFGDWNLVIAAYNCGPGNVTKAIQRAGGARDYWTIYPYLPRETRGYVPAFIAANYIMNYYCEHNICPMKTQLPEQSDTVMVNRNVHLQQIADVCSIDIDLLRTLNPAYRRDVVPGANTPSAIRLPQEGISKFLEMEDSVYNYNTETLLPNRAVVEVPDVPVVTKRKTSVRSKGRRSTRKGRRGSSITIRKGQTLSEIARRNGTTVAKLKRLNGIRGNNIRAGKKLRVR